MTWRPRTAQGRWRRGSHPGWPATTARPRPSTTPPTQLRRLGAKALEVIAPDTYDDHERQRLDAAMRRAKTTTRLTLHQRGDGSVDLHARIPEATATRLRTYLEAFTSPRHDDTAGRAHGLLDPATGRRLPYDKVLGIAFCSLLEAIDPTRLPAHGGQATQVVVTMALAGLQAGTGTGLLADGTPLSAGEVRRLACTAAIIPAVLGGASEVLDLGRTRRLFSTAQRKALALAHPQCQADGWQPGKVQSPPRQRPLVLRRPHRPRRRHRSCCSSRGARPAPRRHRPRPSATEASYALS